MCGRDIVLDMEDRFPGKIVVTKIVVNCRPQEPARPLFQHMEPVGYPVRMEYDTEPRIGPTYVYDAQPKRVEYEWQRPATLIYDGGLLD